MTLARDMVTATFKTADGRELQVGCPEGHTLMEAALAASIDGILAECGGGCLCGTCHVYVDPDWLAKLDPVGSLEAELLTSNSHAHTNSRLSCQIGMSLELDGLRVTVAPRPSY